MMSQTFVAFCDDEDPSLSGVFELTCLKWVILPWSLSCGCSQVFTGILALMKDSWLRKNIDYHCKGTGEEGREYLF